MKTRITLNTINLCAVILLALVNLAKAETLNNKTAGKFIPVDPNKIPEILTMISNRIKSNYDQIKTWQGKVGVITDYIYEGAEAENVFKTNTDGKGETPKIIRDHGEQIIEFSLDAQKEFLYTYYCPTKPLQYTDLETGRNLGAKGIAGQRRSIVTPEYQIDCTGDTMRDGIVTSRRAVKETRPKSGSTCASNMHPVYDPRECFVVGKPIWETFARLLEYIDSHGELSVDGYALKVEERKDGNDTEYRIQIPGKVSPTDYLLMEMVFSNEKGFNIVSFETTDFDGRLLQKITWEYSFVNGVYLPNKTVEQNFEPKNRNLVYEKKCVFENSQINRSILEKTFTYENLGLKNGDKFVDNITGKKYKYQDANLVPMIEAKK